jgi:hypothetical protein
MNPRPTGGSHRIPRSLPLALFLIGAVAASGCGSSLPKIDVNATPESLVELRGDWFGTYASDDTGRHGTIAFILSANPDSAFGDVLMETEDHDWREHDPDRITIRKNHPEQISISFVRIAGGRVAGQLEPYEDPGCGCTLTTVFHGSIEGNKMSGTYTSRHGMSDKVDEGVWNCSRR